MSLDNTTAENKNRFVFGVVGLLVHYLHFYEGTVFFRPVGHTYNGLDAAFGTLINGMIWFVIPTISRLCAVIGEVLFEKRMRVIRELPHVWDFKTQMSEFMNPLGGFATTQHSSGMHEFRISRDAEGVVRLHCRQSSQASGWLPEGPGYKLFKDGILPAVWPEPPIAPMKPDTSWMREEVQTNVRRWLAALGLHTHELRKAEQEWESIFASLPPDGDVTQIPESELLVWPQLPKAAPIYDTPTTGECARMDMTENPPVNPLTGHNRSANQVQIDTAAWQQGLRADAEEQGNSVVPIFMQDYIFFEPPGQRPGTQQQIAFGRVAKTPIGGALLEDDMIEVTEYEHMPQVHACPLHAPLAHSTALSVSYLARLSVCLLRVMSQGSLEHLR